MVCNRVPHVGGPMRSNGAIGTAPFVPSLDESSSMTEISHAINNLDVPITQRMRALFLAKHKGGKEAVEALIGGLHHDSVLFRHEIAYLLGQLGNTAAEKVLTDLLDDRTQDDMVRHEAAEALAAISSKSSIDLLLKHSRDEAAPVRETCELALIALQSDMLESFTDEQQQRNTGVATEFNGIAQFVSANSEDSATQEKRRVSPYNTVDPVMLTSQNCDAKPTELSSILRDPRAPLCRRYEALFALRNNATEATSRMISDSLIEDRSSALLRHEIAFVLGQLQRISSVPSLATCLANKEEHRMARHEAALALGAVVCGNVTGAPTIPTVVSDMVAQAIAALQNHTSDAETVVRESCVVALDNIQEEIGPQQAHSVD
eukprot:GHVS01077001.1.p1 GENE.GHVS01077001.1~~GHVS01077001.1.p1  ORF type:complete len:376 (-),score=51.11 GHVS01077001.1:1110-2237(-)